jgi:formylglycine-generating enzyme required for sulfatase activity
MFTRHGIASRSLLCAAIVACGIGGSALTADSFDGARPGEERQLDGIKFCWCPAGSFTMGSPVTEVNHRPDEVQVDVQLSRGFWMAKFEVTQGDWKRVIGDFPDKPPTPEFGVGDDVPLYWVNFHEAEAYCAALTQKLRSSGELSVTWEVRLPTEAQWEYACRAGTTTATAFGDRLGIPQANFGGPVYNGGDNGPVLHRSTSVGSYPANAWGICDMHGNIFEWCRDWYHTRLPGGTDPDLHDTQGLPNRDGTFSRVRRGGAWIEEGWVCRSATRLRFESPRRSDHIGFRAAVVPLPTAP